MGTPILKKSRKWTHTLTYVVSRLEILTSAPPLLHLFARSDLQSSSSFLNPPLTSRGFRPLLGSAAYASGLGLDDDLLIVLKLSLRLGDAQSWNSSCGMMREVLSTCQAGSLHSIAHLHPTPPYSSVVFSFPVWEPLCMFRTLNDHLQSKTYRKVEGVIVSALFQ